LREIFPSKKVKAKTKYYNIKGMSYYETTLDRYKKIDSDPYTEFTASYIDVYQCGYMGSPTTCVDIAWYINLGKSYKNVTVSGLIIEVYNLVGSGVDYMIYVAGALAKSGHYDSVERDVNPVDYVANYSDAFQIEVKIRYFVTESGYAQLTRDSIIIASLKIRIYHTDDDPTYDPSLGYYIYTVDISIPSTFDPNKVFDSETNIKDEVTLKAFSDRYVSEIAFETGYDPDSATDPSVVRYEIYNADGSLIRSGNASYSKTASFYPVWIDDKSYATASGLSYSPRYTLKVYMKRKMALGLVKIRIGFTGGVLLVYYNNKIVFPYVVNSDDVYLCNDPDVCSAYDYDTWNYIGSGTMTLMPLDGENVLAYGIWSFGYGKLIIVYFD
jgi:hypothetical protein